MKATLTAACFAAACALVAGPVASAQGQTGQAGQTKQQTPAQQAATKPALTLSGCLERDTAPAGQPATQAAFKLTNAKVVPSATGAAAGRAMGQQQAQADKDKDKDKEYRLSAAAGVDLSEHVGHEVEVIGTIAKNEITTTPTPRTGGMTGAGQQPPQRGADKDAHPLLTVTSVRMIATTCSASYE